MTCLIRTGNVKDVKRRKSSGLEPVNAVFAIYLLAVGIVDLKTSSIHLLLLAAGVVPIFLSLLVGGGVSLSERALGLALGLMVLFVSFVSNEELGKGDALLLCVTGAFLGVYGEVFLIGMSFLFVVIYCVILLIGGRLSRKRRIPYAPFVFAGYMLMQVIK